MFKRYSNTATSSSVQSSATRPTVRLSVHTDSINSLAAVRSGMVLSGSSDKTISLNNMDTGASSLRWRGHEREVTKVIYKRVASKHFVLSASKDCTIRLWCFQSQRSCRSFLGHSMPVTALTSLEGDKFASGSRDGCLNVWDINSDQPSPIAHNNRNMITHIEYEPSRQMICQTSEDGCLRLWDRRSRALICEFPSKTYSLIHCAVCPQTMICSTAGAGSCNHGGSYITLWDLRQRKLFKELYGHESNVRCSAFIPPQSQFTWKHLLLSVSDDRTARVWNINNGVCLWTETIPAELNACLAFPDGSVTIGGGSATLCDMRLKNRAGRPVLLCNSIQSTSLDLIH